MLVISRRKGQRVCIGEDIEIVVTEVHRSSVKFGIVAPGKNVVRAEIREAPSVKPPLGAVPRRIWEVKALGIKPIVARVAELEQAVLRYVQAGLEPLPEWLEELEEHRRGSVIG